MHLSDPTHGEERTRAPPAHPPAGLPELLCTQGMCFPLRRGSKPLRLCLLLRSSSTSSCQRPGAGDTSEDTTACFGKASVNQPACSPATVAARRDTAAVSATSEEMPSCIPVCVANWESASCVPSGQRGDGGRLSPKIPVFNTNPRHEPARGCCRF